MLATAVRRGDQRHPTVVFDDFARAAGPNLGRTPVGFLEWERLRGGQSWFISNSVLVAPASGLNPSVVVTTRFSDVSIEVENNHRGGGIAFRATDAGNFLSLSSFYTVTTTETTVTERNWIYITAPVNIGGVNHSHDYSTWEVEGEGPNDFRPQHSHGAAGDHGDPLALGPESVLPSRTRVVGTTTSMSRALRLDRIENDSVTQLGTWSIPSTAPFRIGVEASGDQIQVYLRSISGVRTNIGSGPVTSSFNQNATRHGITGRQSGSPAFVTRAFSLTAP